MTNKATALERLQFGNKHSVMLKEGALYLPKGAPVQMPKDSALVFAAWIVRLCDETRGEKFSQILRTVRGISS